MADLITMDMHMAFFTGTISLTVRLPGKGYRHSSKILVKLSRNTSAGIHRASMRPPFCNFLGYGYSCRKPSWLMHSRRRLLRFRNHCLYKSERMSLISAANDRRTPSENQASAVPDTLPPVRIAVLNGCRPGIASVFVKSCGRTAWML